MLDLVHYQSYIGRRTKFGDKPGPDAWFYTRKLLSEHPDDPTKPNLEDIVSLFHQLGVNDEVQAAMFIGINMKHVP